jgi:ribosome recycling factor
MAESILRDADEKLKRGIETVQREFVKIRTGRANASMLDGVKVDYYGTLTPVGQMASVSIPEARLIIIQPWDAKMLGAIEKAIQKSDLGIAPVNDGKIVRLPIPQLTEERRRDLVKQSKRILEDGKVALRNTRRELLEALKKLEKDGKISEDERTRDEESVQKLVEAATRKLDELATLKEKEIMTV